MKNIFAVMSGLVALTVRRFPESRAFADELLDRLPALSEAHDDAWPQGHDEAPQAALARARRPGRAGATADRVRRRLVDLTLREQLAGELPRTWHPEGLQVHVSLPIERLVGAPRT